MAKTEISGIDTLKIFVKRWKLFTANFFIVVVLVSIVCLLLPISYRAQTTILPPIEDSDLMGVSSLLSDLPLKALGLGSQISGQTDLFLAILKSRTIMEAVIDKFDLMRKYEAKNIEIAIKKLSSYVAVNLNDEGTITLSMQVETPWLGNFSSRKKDEARELSKNIANYFITQLDSINRTLQGIRAKNARIFIEKRYWENQNDLRQAEQKLNEFQKKYGIVSLPEQATVTIKAAAELKAQMIEKEVRLGVLKSYVGDQHPDYIREYSELKELEKKYNEFKTKSGKQNILEDDQVVSTDLFLQLNKTPDLILQNARLLRETLLQQKIMEFLLPQYEQAKIQEAKDTPTVQVLDKAEKPIKKYKPKRSIIVIFWGFISLISTSLYVYCRPAVSAFWREMNSD